MSENKEVEFVYVYISKKDKLEISVKNSEEITKYFPRNFIDAVCQNLGLYVIDVLKKLKNTDILITELEEIKLLTVILTTNEDDESYVNVINTPNAELLLPENIIKEICIITGNYIGYMLDQLKPKKN